jgi:hypothetical protein
MAYLDCGTSSINRPIGRARFGLELSLRASRLRSFVTLVTEAEGSDLDFITVREDPLVLQNVDLWVLLSAAATVTSRIQLVPRIQGIDNTPAYSTARKVASLHSLARNRVGLWLDATHDSDRSTSLVRLSPGEFVLALRNFCERELDQHIELWASGGESEILDSARYIDAIIVSYFQVPPANLSKFQARLDRALGTMQLTSLPTRGYYLRGIVRLANGQLSTDVKDMAFGGTCEEWIAAIVEFYRTLQMQIIVFAPGEDDEQARIFMNHVVPRVKAELSRHG